MAAHVELEGARRPKRADLIRAQLFNRARQAGIWLGHSETRLQLLWRDLAATAHVIPSTHSGNVEVVDAESLLIDVYSRLERCWTNVATALTQVANPSVIANDRSLLLELHADLFGMREMLSHLEQDCNSAKQYLRSRSGYIEESSLITQILVTEKKVDILKAQLDASKREIGKFEESLRNSQNLRALMVSRYVQTPHLPSVDHGRCCPLYDTGFLALDSIPTPCGHFYHLFCLAILLSVRTDCDYHGCGAHFPRVWLESFGFLAIEDTDFASRKTSNSTLTDTIGMTHGLATIS